MAEKALYETPHLVDVEEMAGEEEFDVCITGGGAKAASPAG